MGKYRVGDAMIDQAVIRPPFWFWVVAVAALLWESAGCFAYLTQVRMSEADLAQLPAAQQEIWRMMPAWVTGAYATAVWAGLLAAIGLLRRKGWARPMFLLSWVAALIQFGWTFLATPILRTMPFAEAVALPAAIILIGLFLLWFAGYSGRRGWIG